LLSHQASSKRPASSSQHTQSTEPVTTPRSDGRPPVNLALNKPVIVSSKADVPGWAPDDATDGDTTPSTNGENSGWASQPNTSTNATEWIEVDLGSVEPIDEVDLYPRNDPDVPGGCFPRDFSILVSSDGNAWTRMASETNYPAPGTRPQRFTFSRTSARYVKVTGTQLTQDEFGQYYFELKEVEVFNR
jgi:hypothetical protein